MYPGEIVELLAQQDGRCGYCRIELGRANVTVEHVIPRSWGGPKQGQNRVLACNNCNSYKSKLESLTARDFPEGSGLDKCAQLIVRIMKLRPAQFEDRHPLPLNMARYLVEQSDRVFGRKP